MAMSNSNQAANIANLVECLQGLRAEQERTSIALEYLADCMDLCSEERRDLYASQRRADRVAQELTQARLLLDSERTSSQHLSIHLETLRDRLHDAEQQLASTRAELVAALVSDEGPALGLDLTSAGMGARGPPAIPEGRDHEDYYDFNQLVPEKFEKILDYLLFVAGALFLAGCAWALLFL